MSPRSVALVTAPRYHDRWPEPETPAILAALEARGIPTETVPWYAGADWSAYGLVVLRSPWDLYVQVDDFLLWLRSAARVTRVMNPEPVIHWTLDKHYLGDLADAGVSVVPTTFVAVGDQAPPFPHPEFVVKPVTSGGAMNTARYRPDQSIAARAHIAFLHSQGMAAMIQPYIADVDRSGERALIFFNGVFDHAIRKQAVLKPDEPADAQREPHPQPQPYAPEAAELALARAALAAVPAPDGLLYARVDMAVTADGHPAIMELELVDPVLFTARAQRAATRRRLPPDVADAPVRPARELRLRRHRGC